MNEKMIDLVRIDKGTGKREPEAEGCVWRLIGEHYPPEVRESVWRDLIAGERQFYTKFAIYEIKGFVPYSKRRADICPAVGSVQKII